MAALGLSCGTWIFVATFQLLVVACGVSFPDQGSNPGPLHWECRVLTTGPPGKSLHGIFINRTDRDMWNWAVGEAEAVKLSLSPESLLK